MKREEIDKILEDLNKTKDKNIVIIDFGKSEKSNIYAEDFEYRLNMDRFRR